LTGGLLIGLATAVLLLFNGRIAGISGIPGSLLRPVRGDIKWRIAFILSLVLSVAFSLLAPLPKAQIDADSSALIVADLLVELGARYGSGYAQSWRLRSVMFVAALVCGYGGLYGAGFITIFIGRHLIS
jgi:hypothetical protein